MICRLGYTGTDTVFPFWFATDNLENRNDSLFNNKLKFLHEQAGVYPVTDIEIVKQFCRLSLCAIKNATCIKIWNINFLPELYLTKLNEKIITSYPFYDKTWYEYFQNQRILIISSHTDTMKEQWFSNNIFKAHDKSITYQDTGIQLTFVKSYISNGNLTPHSSYLETLSELKKDVEAVASQFDYALVSCGSYGLPICDYIFTTLNKSSIYVGGHLQLFFCIKGRRWDHYNIYNEYWVQVPEDKRPKNYQMVENGCYF